LEELEEHNQPKKKSSPKTNEEELIEHELIRQKLIEEELIEQEFFLVKKIEEELCFFFLRTKQNEVVDLSKAGMREPFN
jgi:hypothetical protein